METHNKIDTVIFDLDGTLLYTLEDLTDATNYALAACGMPLRALDEVRQFVGNGIRNLMRRAVPDGEDNPRFEEAFTVFEDIIKIIATIRQGHMKGYRHYWHS